MTLRCAKQAGDELHLVVPGDKAVVSTDGVDDESHRHHSYSPALSASGVDSHAYSLIDGGPVWEALSHWGEAPWEGRGGWVRASLGLS